MSLNCLDPALFFVLIISNNKDIQRFSRQISVVFHLALSKHRAQIGAACALARQRARGIVNRNDAVFNTLFKAFFII